MLHDWIDLHRRIAYHKPRKLYSTRSACSCQSMGSVYSRAEPCPKKSQQLEHTLYLLSKAYLVGKHRRDFCRHSIIAPSSKPILVLVCPAHRRALHITRTYSTSCRAKGYGTLSALLPEAPAATAPPVSAQDDAD